MSSVSRRIARDGVRKGGLKLRQNEVKADKMAVALGVDLYHARIALKGTTISPAGFATLERRAKKQAELRAELRRLVAA